MTTLLEAAQQALEALKNNAGEMRVEGAISILETALRAALAQQAEPQDAELSAALGWPGGISDPILDRKTLLRQVADLRAALAQQAEPLINQCGETCERAKLCAVCASKLAEPVEPVAWMVYTVDGQSAYVTDNPSDIKEGQSAHALFPGPVEQVLLTDKEILLAAGWERAEMWMKLAPNFPVDEAKQETLKNARAVERAVWEKNHG